jgi:hypothetical protein
MIQGLLVRTETSDQGTFGILSIGGFVCHAAEPPWRDNRPGLSCIPPGEYLVEPWHSARFPRTFHLRNVLDRDAILIHAGNLAGDPAGGYRRHTLGCILPGMKRGMISGQRAVLLSSSAMNTIRKTIGFQRFALTIKGEGPWNG